MDLILSTLGYVEDPRINVPEASAEILIVPLHKPLAVVEVNGPCA
jgi:hypothetical protein